MSEGATTCTLPHVPRPVNSMTNYSHADVQVADAGFFGWSTLYGLLRQSSACVLLFVAQDTTKRHFKGSLRPLTPDRRIPRQPGTFSVTLGHLYRHINASWGPIWSFSFIVIKGNLVIHHKYKPTQASFIRYASAFLINQSLPHLCHAQSLFTHRIYNRQPITSRVFHTSSHLIFLKQ